MLVRGYCLWLGWTFLYLLVASSASFATPTQQPPAGRLLVPTTRLDTCLSEVHSDAFTALRDFAHTEAGAAFVLDWVRRRLFNYYRSIDYTDTILSKAREALAGRLAESLFLRDAFYQRGGAFRFDNRNQIIHFYKYTRDLSGSHHLTDQQWVQWGIPVEAHFPIDTLIAYSFKNAIPTNFPHALEDNDPEFRVEVVQQGIRVVVSGRFVGLHGERFSGQVREMDFGWQDIWLFNWDDRGLISQRETVLYEVDGV